MNLNNLTKSPSELSHGELLDLIAHRRKMRHEVLPPEPKKITKRKMRTEVRKLSWEQLMAEAKANEKLRAELEERRC